MLSFCRNHDGMNRIYFKPNIPNQYVIKILLIMRLTTALLLVTLMQVSASGFGQRITFVKKGSNLMHLAEAIKKQIGYNLLWSESLIDSREALDFNFYDIPIEKVIDRIVAGRSATYEIIGKSIAIKEAAPSFRDQVIGFFAGIDVTGSVLDENNAPLVGAVVKVKGTSRTVVTDKNGEFLFKGVDEKAVLVISFLGFETQEIIASKDLGDIKMVMSNDDLQEVEIVSTGYQSLSKDKIVGSFIKIDSKLLSRSVTTNVLDRIKDVAPGIYFKNIDPQLNLITTNPLLKTPQIVIRGESTYSGSKEPLIVLDNFPYEGDIRNINPNDIETITILKDASSASIWGARSANGVIVMTTKKGKVNQKTSIDFSSNVTLISKPDLFYAQDFLNSKSYIEVEKYLYEKGFFNAQLNNTTTFPTVSPAVELMKKYDLATSDVQKTDIQNQIDQLKNNDVRRDYDSHFYQRAINQQYSLGLRGGTSNMTYALSVGHDNNRNNLIRNGSNRTTVNSVNTYKPIKNLELTVGINYSKNSASNNNSASTGRVSLIGSPYSSIFPYTSLVDEDGNSQTVLQGFRSSYLESTKSKGFLDWNYRPLDELNLADNVTKENDLLLTFGLQYQILPGLKASLNYQNERQLINERRYRSVETYEARNLINRFSVYTPSTGTIVYNFPKGGILDLTNTEWNSSNLRGQLNFVKSINKHDFSILLGAEGREFKIESYNRTSYGYNEQFGSAVGNLNYGTGYPTNPTGSGLIPAPLGTVMGTLNRNVSYYAIANYAYNNRYTLNVSLRKDGANLFGAKTNDKISPFWSTGIAWNINEENFYGIDWLSNLRLRATYGYQGNTSYNSSYLAGAYIVDGTIGAPVIIVTAPPNPSLRWENVRNINIGIDFATNDNALQGSIEVYQKNGKDLIQPTDLAPQTGFAAYQANSANIETKGIDILLQTENLKGKFGWNTTLSFSGIKDKVVKYDVPRNSSSILLNSYTVGRPLNALFSYKWSGINSENGNPLGYLNGKISEDYSAIINNFSPDSLVYGGSLVPTIYGAIRNDFSYKKFNLSLNITYRFGYVFRRTTTSINYTDVINRNAHSDYDRRWKTTGDENITDVPSLVYPSNSLRNSFYQSSEVLVESGDHIRLQDIRFGYEFNSKSLKKLNITNINLFSYASNLGILWRKNKHGIDPSNVGSSWRYPSPLSISFGLTANF